MPAFCTVVPPAWALAPPQAVESDKPTSITPNAATVANRSRPSVALKGNGARSGAQGNPNTAISASSPRVPRATGKVLGLSPIGGVSRVGGESHDAAAVAIDTVVEAILEPFKLTDDGLKVQVAPDGAPLQLKPTAPDRPPSGVMLML